MQIQGLEIPGIQSIQRMGHVTLSLAPRVEAIAEGRRWICSEGDEYDVMARLDLATFDQVVGWGDWNRVVWVTDSYLGNFHAIMEVQGSRLVDSDLESKYDVIIHLLVTVTVFDVTKFNPLVFA